MSVLDILEPHIREFEGLRLEAYKCPGGAWTIGYGHTGGVVPGQVITHAEAERLLAQDIADASRTLRQTVRVPLTDHQRAALTSLIFNIGAGAWRSSTCLKRLNAGDHAGAAEALTWWNKITAADGRRVVSGGLRRRREAERRMFMAEPDLARDGPVEAVSGGVDADELKPMSHSKEMAAGITGAVGGFLGLWSQMTATLSPEVVDLATKALPLILLAIAGFVIWNRVAARRVGQR